MTTPEETTPAAPTVEETTQAVGALTTLISFFKNKTSVMALLAASLYGYTKIPASENGVPFIELAYTGITIILIPVLATVLRMLVFHEAAAYAETGQLDADLKKGAFTPALAHYWFATAICYAISAVPLATIAK